MTPLKPNIKCEVVPRLTVCGCCGTEDGTVKQLVLGWTERAPRPNGGSSSSSLCAKCRALVVKALEPS
jgi:hypothetical protein